MHAHQRALLASLRNAISLGAIAMAASACSSSPGLAPSRVGGTLAGQSYGVAAAAPEQPGAHRWYVTNYVSQTVTEYAASGLKHDDEAPIAILKGGSTGISFPGGIAADSAGRMYVAAGQYPGAILVFAANLKGLYQGPPLAVVAGGNSGVTGPTGVALDASGRIYVSNNEGSLTAVLVFAAHPRGNVSGPPLATIAGPQTGLEDPTAIAVGPDGDIYVANAYGNGNITVYPANPVGTLDEAPLATIGGGSTGINGPTGVAVDSSGLIYVSNQNPSPGLIGSVTVYAAHPQGSITGPPIATIGGVHSEVGFPGGVALDAAGNVLVSDQYADEIGAYAPHPRGSIDDPPIASIVGAQTHLLQPRGIAAR